MVGKASGLPERYESPSRPDDDPPLVVNVATLQRRKGPDLFIDVASRVCAEHPTVRFLWVGKVLDHAFHRELEEEIEARGLSSRVEFVGHVDPPFEWMRRASVMLFTSRSEAFGNSVAEAMACFRTVICFAGTGAEFAVGDTGEVIPGFDVDKAAGRVSTILKRSPSDRINHDARRRYEMYFSPDAYADRLSAVLSGEAVHEVIE